MTVAELHLYLDQRSVSDLKKEFMRNEAAAKADAMMSNVKFVQAMLDQTRDDTVEMYQAMETIERKMEKSRVEPRIFHLDYYYGSRFCSRHTRRQHSHDSKNLSHCDLQRFFVEVVAPSTYSLMSASLHKLHAGRARQNNAHECPHLQLP